MKFERLTKRDKEKNWNITVTLSRPGTPPPFELRYSAPCYFFQRRVLIGEISQITAASRRARENDTKFLLGSCFIETFIEVFISI